MRNSIYLIKDIILDYNLIGGTNNTSGVARNKGFIDTGDLSNNILNILIIRSLNFIRRISATTVRSIGY